MPSNRLLISLLRSLQTYADQQDTPRLLSTAAYLLTTLSNPANLTLVTAQLLSAPAIWTQPDGLRACQRFMGVFQSAAITILRHEEELHDNRIKSQEPPTLSRDFTTLSKDEWARAIINGADHRSPSWMHLMVLTGVLTGFDTLDRRELSRSLRVDLESAIVRSMNLALEDVTTGGGLAQQCAVLMLNYGFEHLSSSERLRINYDLLLPVLIESAFISQEGYGSGYFLAMVDMDIVQTTRETYTWSDRSTSFHHVLDITSKPLITAMGPLSRLTAHAVEHTKDPQLIRSAAGSLLSSARTLATQWRQSRISRVDVSEESKFFDEQTLAKSLPVLWRLLRSVLFATTVILSGVVGRILGDRSLANDEVAPVLAREALLILRHLYFISSRLGSKSFSQHNFVYLAAVDILSAYPSHAEAFIHEIRPQSAGQIPHHPLDRNLDLYFLNTAEHFTLTLSAQINENVLIAAALPYLASGGNNHLLEIFEAAHSLMLAVLSVPQSSDIAAKHLPFYVDALFQVFPRNLSARQFRLAFKTLLRITTPPSPLSITQPDIAETLLELLHHRALVDDSSSNSAFKTTLPTLSVPSSMNNDVSGRVSEEQLDEPTTLTLTLIDSLPALPLHLLEEWLPLAAELISKLNSLESRQKCKDRFWEVLSNGEMDVERSRVCVTWWHTRGGRELVLFGADEPKYEMSGALTPKETDGHSKL